VLLLSAPLFGPKHAIGVLAVLILAAIASMIIYNKKVKINNRRAILIFMIMFYILEIAKLSYIMYPNWSFPIYQLPLHLCSLPLYLYPLMYFLKPGIVVERYIKPTAYSVVMLAGIMALALPTNILGDAVSWLPLKDNVLPIISFLFHGLMIFSSIFLLRSGYYKFRLNDMFRAILCTTIFAGIAMTANELLDKDFMLLHYGNGSPLQFINDKSHVLYLFSMIGLAVVLIIFSFTITNWVILYERARKSHPVRI